MMYPVPVHVKNATNLLVFGRQRRGWFGVLGLRGDLLRVFDGSIPVFVVMDGDFERYYF